MPSDVQKVDSRSTNNTNTRLRSNSALKNWKKQSYKQYQPKFLNSLTTSGTNALSTSSTTKDIPLPSIECFELQYILNNVLTNESQQVINDLLKVTTNYQNDLRNEIKKNLSIEQKIQFKNISICKNIHQVNQIIHQRKKKLKKVVVGNSKFNYLLGDGSHQDENDINQLLIKSVEISDRVKSTTKNLRALELKVSNGESFINNEKYPNLFRLFNKEKPKEEPPTSYQDILPQKLTTPTVSNKQFPDDEDDQPPSIDLSPKNSICSSEETQKSTSTEVEEEEAFKNNISLITITKPLPAQSTSPQSNATIEFDGDIEPSEFENFMSSSIAKYRTLQKQKQASKQILAFENDNDRNGEIDNDDEFINANNIIEFPSNSIIHNNPLNLLYSQLISNPKYQSQESELSTPPRKNNYPFASILSIKSSATIKSTDQISHFKKLRINGSPLNTEHYRKKLEKENNHTKKIDDAVLAETLLETLVVDAENQQKEQDNIGNNEDDELWNSSGLTSEEENEEETNIILMNNESQELNDLNSNFSSTSDSDSDSESDYTKTNEINPRNLTNIQFTNQYYNNLQKDFKQKQQQQQQQKQKQKRKLKNSKELSPIKISSLHIKELSPTPKHKPSHHILKPKRSILKTQPQQQFPKKSIKIITSAQTSNKSSRSSSFDKKLHPEDISALSELNSNYSSKIGNIINKCNVNGTIVTKRRKSNEIDEEVEVSGSDDENDQESILILKNYVK
ncbi:hypothetical protein KGF54_003173 [Candida jiufengensis]|uniref:uncharacterized protein n=1 Tax=Candida jiufengensis TaxID=497108 RepID=UPI0022258D4A|nr:uncharacterized protein KGF54_003173 [Candida jiufengensis]KAI5952307.1 hypothetical protein KGF54_003173 [Candida jiufengensis]